MKAKLDLSPSKTTVTKSKSVRQPARITAYQFVLALMILTGCWAWAQSVPQPVLTITPTGSNQMTINITNGVSTANYDLYWTPVLADPSHPWQAVVIGSTGQTNFTVSMGIWQSQFYRVVVDTNAVPIWQAADPNNPGAGILAVFIDSPASGTILQ